VTIPNNQQHVSRCRPRLSTKELRVGLPRTYLGLWPLTDTANSFVSSFLPRVSRVSVYCDEVEQREEQGRRRLNGGGREGVRSKASAGNGVRRQTSWNGRESKTRRRQRPKGDSCDPLRIRCLSPFIDLSISAALDPGASLYRGFGGTPASETNLFSVGRTCVEMDRPAPETLLR
jgi:hypothetical protein